MHQPAFLAETVIMFGTALIAAWLFRILRAPSILGFLVTGILIGPPVLNLVPQDHVAEFAELGLVLLLFIIGLELSPTPLLRMGKSLFTASFLQIGLTGLVTMLVLHLAFGVTLFSAGILGIAVALSSTAIVLKILSDERENDTLRGRITTGILLIQDVVVICIMLFLPLFAKTEQGDGISPATRFIIGMAGLLAVIGLSRKLLPYFLDHVIRPGGPEFVTLFAVVMAFGGASLAGLAGWSLPLGACIAGLLLSAADERHQIVADILPFRDVFNALFFISLGMLVDIEIVMRDWQALLIAVGATLIVKAAITTLSVRAGKWTLRPALHAGIGLCTVSEFGYVLASQADRLGILDEGLLEGLIVYALGTMAVGAFLMPHSEFLVNRLLRVFLPSRTEPELADDGNHPHRTSHVIIVGYGVNGQNLVRVFQSTHLPYCLIEMSPKLAQQAKAAEVELVVGDASRMAILNEAGLQTARALVVAINDPGATARIVSRARDARGDVFILARTRFVSEIEPLYAAGANLVIPEEFETSIEIAAHLLRRMDIPDNVVEGQIAAIRAGGYGMLRGKPVDRAFTDELMAVLQSTVTRTHYVAQNSTADGRTLAELNLRAKTGVTIIAVVRNGKPTTNPNPDVKIQHEDVLVLVGAHAQLDAAKTYLQQTAV